MVIVGKHTKKFAAKHAGARRRRAGQAMDLNGELGAEDAFALGIDLQNAQQVVEGEAIGLEDEEAQYTYARVDFNNTPADEEDDIEVLVAVNQAAAVEPIADECEFPAQALDLERVVTITNTTPRVTDVNTDICGNVVSYTERMTRNMAASAWVPLAGLQGRVANLEVADDQEIFIQGNRYADVANSRGLADLQASGVPYNVTSQQLVGKKRRAGARHVPNHNVNAAYGAALMRKFRSA